MDFDFATILVALTALTGGIWLLDRLVLARRRREWRGEDAREPWPVEYARSLFPVILLGIFFKRVNKEGAIAGMLAGLLFTYGYIEYFKGLFLKWAGAPWGEDVPAEWLFGISPEGIGVIGMLLNFAVAIAVSYGTSAPPERIQALVERIRVPRAIEEH